MRRRAKNTPVRSFPAADECSSVTSEVRKERGAAFTCTMYKASLVRLVDDVPEDDIERRGTDGQDFVVQIDEGLRERRQHRYILGLGHMLHVHQPVRYRFGRLSI